jgi:glycosyltransferase involved in cell wall biosynthesis
MRILHIAAHVGGGIGSAYIGLGADTEEHRLLLLEKPLDTVTLSRVEQAGFRIILGADREQICKELEEADIVVFNWTHHPAMTLFLRELPAVPIRSALWCHISGNYYPIIPAAFVRKFDQVMFATPFSIELPQLRALGDNYAREHFHVVYGLNDLSRFGQIEPQRHTGFCVGYVGTLGYCKLNPSFVSYSAAVDIPNVRFVLAGTPSTKDQIISEGDRKGIAEKIYFLGQIRDVPTALSEMDVFGYLLNSQHFGATENALLEAMAAGLPVVALDQCVERHIIQNGVTGLLVHSPEEYGQAIRYLHDNRDKARELGLCARNTVLERYDIRTNRRRFYETCKRAFSYPKRIHRFDDFFKGGPADWFLSCVGEERACFEENRPQDAGAIFREPTKGSPIHYHAYFPQDKRLSNWAKILRT